MWYARLVSRTAHVESRWFSVGVKDHLRLQQLLMGRMHANVRCQSCDIYHSVYEVNYSLTKREVAIRFHSNPVSSPILTTFNYSSPWWLQKQIRCMVMGGELGNEKHEEEILNNSTKKRHYTSDVVLSPNVDKDGSLLPKITKDRGVRDAMVSRILVKLCITF